MHCSQINYLFPWYELINPRHTHKNAVQMQLRLDEYQRAEDCKCMLHNTRRMAKQQRQSNVQDAAKKCARAKSGLQINLDQHALA